MIILLLTLVVVGATAYVWSTRGFFSALIHMLCTLAAGAIAFGVWEPVGYALLNASPDRGFFSFLSGIAWGLALALPFSIALAILRVAVDKLLPANAQCDTAADYIGGAVCGGVAGVISGGIMILSIGYLRVGPDFGGYRPINYTSGVARGSLEASKETFVPWVDRIAAGLYERLSLTTLRTGEPLAKWHPNLVTEPGALRTTYDGKSRNTYTKGAFSLLGTYTVGDPARGEKLEYLLSDSWDDVPQKISDLSGESPTTGYIAGFIVKLTSMAREKTGQIVIGNGQIRLVCGNDENEEYIAAHPIAVVTNVEDPTKVEYARFRYNSDDLFIASAGGASEATMAFEFPVPTGFKPIALYVKGVRVNLEEQPQPTNFENTILRDEMIRSGQMAGMGNVGPILDPVTGQPVPGIPNQVAFGPGIMVSNALGFMIQKGTERGLEVAEEGRGWTVRDGEVKLTSQQLRGATSGLDPKLQINRFSTTDDTVIVKVDVSPSRRTPDFTKLMDLAEKGVPPTLIDTNGTKYEAVGFLYKDSSITQLRFTKGQPLKGMGDAPSVSRSTPDRQLTLVFVVSLGVQISEFRIGNSVIETYTPPVKCDQRQK